MGAFEYSQAEEIRDAFSRYRVRYLLLENPARSCWDFPIRRKTRTFTSKNHPLIARQPSQRCEIWDLS
jgi:hypothetical protein